MHPDYARRGIGRTLIERAEAWARERGLPALTLTSYVEVPWNGPYYERLGFHYLASGEETPEFAEEIVQPSQETATGT